MLLSSLQGIGPSPKATDDGLLNIKGLKKKPLL